MQVNALDQGATHLGKETEEREAMSHYSLLYGDTRLGVLTRYETDWPWTFCHFVADPPFAGIQPLFEESFRLSER